MVIICKMSMRSEKQMKWDPLYNFQGFFCKVVKPTPTLVLHVLCFNKTKKRKIKIRKKEKERNKERKKKKKERMKPSQNRNVLSDISFCNVLSEHHSSLNLTTTPHYVLMSYLPTYLPPYRPQKGSSIFLKLSTL